MTKAKLLSKELDKFELFKFEKVQLINHLPKNIYELDLIIINCSERFNETQRQEMLVIINQK